MTLFHLELLLTSFDSLYRQKLRSTLTILGVAIGIATLVASVSVGVGVRRIIEDGFKREHRLREITIYSGGGSSSDDLSDIPADEIKIDGNLSPERKKRIQQKLARLWRLKTTPTNRKLLTPERIHELGKIEHVIRAEPVLVDSCQAIYNQRIASCIIGSQPDRPETIQALVTEGRLAEQPGEATIHEFLLYRLGLKSDEAMLAILDKEIRIEFRGTDRRQTDLLMQFFNADTSQMSTSEEKAIDRVRDLLPGAIKTLPLSDSEKGLLIQALSRPRKNLPSVKELPTIGTDLRIVGIHRSPERENDLLSEAQNSEIALTHNHALELFNSLPSNQKMGFSQAVLTVDSEDSLRSVCDHLKREGYQFHAIGIYLQIARKNTLLIGFTMDFIALLALTVASLGIMNTMFTAVLERTREIGILKAVGARDRHIMLTFLFEGASIGILGGLLGLLLGWLVSFPGDSYALKLIREQDPNMVQPTTVFRYPWWLLVGAPLFAIFVTTMAGLLPAKRAASIEPVEALRYE